MCNLHEETALPEKGPRRCSALTKAGRRCRNWAMVGETVCGVHGRAHHWPRAGLEAPRCTATTASGAQCRRWAEPDEDPPLCWIHAHPQEHPRLRHGYYQQLGSMSPERQAVVNALTEKGHGLEAQIWLMRLRLSGVLAYSGQELPLEQWCTLARLAQRGVRKVARLQRERRKG